MPDHLVLPSGWSLAYHVPRSQVWQGSGGRAHGNVHLHAPAAPGPIGGEHDGPCQGRPCTAHQAAYRARRDAVSTRLTALTGRRATLVRGPREPLCGKPSGWYERPPSGDDLRDRRCPRCVALAARYGIDWP